MQELAGMALVEKHDNDTWFLTVAAMQKLRSSMVLSSPAPVPLLRPNCSLLTMTMLELVLTMEKEEWQALSWDAAPGKPLPYAVGKAKHFYIKTGLNKYYMLALLHAQELRDIGVPEILMGELHLAQAVLQEGGSCQTITKASCLRT